MSKDGDEDCTAFDLLHSERGFVAFEQWYRRVLANAPGSGVSKMPAPELGMLWPQAYCPPNALHEHAFVELIHAFVECSDGEALDLFDLMDHSFLGMLGLPQVYVAICLVAALGSRQLTKFLYFHSSRLFGILAIGCRLSAKPEHVTWPRLLVFLRLLGAQSHLLSHVAADLGIAPLSQLRYDDFVEVVFAVASQLDRGTDMGECTVINEGDRVGHVRSRMCVML